MDEAAADPEIEPKRSRLGRLHGACVAYCVGGLAVWLVVAVSVLGSPAQDRIAVRGFFAWVLGVMILSVVVRRVRCPRCAQRFFSGAYGTSPLARSCLHCGLALGRARGTR